MPRQIFLFSSVHSGSSEFLIRQLLALDRESNEEITIFINSPGGSVIELFAIIDTMKMIKSPIRTVVMGMAASAAAIIAAAGDTRLITENSQVMIHEIFAIALGTVSEMEDKVKLVTKMQDVLLNLLAKSTGKSVDKLKALIKKTDKFFSAKESVRFGLSDKIIKSNEAQLLKLSESINVEGYQIAYKEEGLSDVQLLKTGKFYHPEFGEVLISEDNLDMMVKNFNNRVRGIDVSLDYTHENEDGEDPAACWVKSLEIRGEELWAQVEFTPKGHKLVLEKEFKYASADFSINYVTEEEKHVPYVLRGGTLTNRPFIKGMHPIKLSEYHPVKKEKTKMDRAELINALRSFGIDVDGLQNQIDALTAEKEELQNRIQELNALPAGQETEIANLKKELSDLNNKVLTSSKEKVFNQLVTEGKVLPAQKDSILNTFKSVKDLETFYKDAPVVIKTKAKGGSHEVLNEDGITIAEQALIDNGTYTKETILKNRTSEKTV